LSSARSMVPKDSRARVSLRSASDPERTRAQGVLTTGNRGYKVLQASCHCGAIGLSVPSEPDHLVDCNCSLCHRYGALWALYEPATVGLSGRLDQLVAYVWGKRSIRTMHCGVCGCVTHWEPITADGGDKFGVNMRNSDPALINSVKTRKFDGAETWTFLE